MKVFISYEPNTSKDFVDELCKRLRTISVMPICINLHQAYGPSIRDHILQVAGNCDRVLVIWSQAYLESDWQIRELNAFLMGQKEMGHDDWVVPVVTDDARMLPLFERAPVDCRGGVGTGFDSLHKCLYMSPRAFMVMKYGDRAVDSMFGKAREVFEEFGYAVCRIDQIANAGSITNQILSEIAKSDVVLADLTDARPNCYYEAGYADALQKAIVFTARNGTEVHFDLSTRRQIRWTSRRFDQFQADLRRHLNEIRKGGLDPDVDRWPAAAAPRPTRPSSAFPGSAAPAGANGTDTRTKKTPAAAHPGARAAANGKPVGRN